MHVEKCIIPPWGYIIIILPKTILMILYIYLPMDIKYVICIDYNYLKYQIGIENHFVGISFKTSFFDHNNYTQIQKVIWWSKTGLKQRLKDFRYIFGVANSIN